MKIIIEGSMHDMSPEAQESVWALSRAHEVYVRDANGEFWQVLDLTSSSTRNDAIKMLLRDAEKPDVLAKAIEDL